MKIAIYQGFLYIHYEMLGYILEYFIHSNLSFDLYCPDESVGKDWKEFYEKTFGVKLNFINPTQIKPANYNLIFLITDDDYSFEQKWLDDFGEEKVICIDHSVHIRRQPTNMLRLSTRFFHFRPQCLWALPVYTYINKLDKMKYLAQTDKINVMCVGTQNKPYSGEFLKELFYNFDSIDFHVITRYLDKNYQNYPNIKTYENYSTQKMMELLKNTQYILCFENPDNLEPVSNCISASIPLAFDSGCQLIIPKSWDFYYNLKSVITYEDTLLQKNNATTKMFLNGQIDLNKIYNEAYELINHKNKTFDYIIQTKLGKYKVEIKHPNSLFTDINNKIIRDKPNVVVDLTDSCDIIRDLTNHFREVNCFVDKNLNENKVFYHSDKEYFLTDTVFKICEPCFFIIKADSNCSDYLSKLSSRGYIDLILITEKNHNTIEIIKTNYKKIYSLYPVNNNSILILSQK